MPTSSATEPDLCGHRRGKLITKWEQTSPLRKRRPALLQMLSAKEARDDPDAEEDNPLAETGPARQRCTALAR